MQVKKVMSYDVKTIRASHSLDGAARILRDSDCGCMAVVDEASRVKIVTAA